MSEVILRKTQKLVIDRVRKAIAEGKTDIFIQAPTGVGKSIIALELTDNITSYVLTSEKSLQQQYEENTKVFDSYGYAKSICGVDTYSCNVNKEKFSLGVCKTLGLTNKAALMLPCAANCEYLQRWKEAREAPATIMNYSYALIQWNYVLKNLGDIAPFQNREIVLCDEAHKLPDIIEDHFACSINAKFIEQLKRVIQMNSSFDIDAQPLYDAIIALLQIPLTKHNKVHLEALKNLEYEYAQVLKSFVSLKEQLGKKYLRQGSISEMKKSSEKVPREIKSLFSMCDNLKDRHCKIQDYVENIIEHGDDNMVVDEEEKMSRRYHNLSDDKLFDNHFRKFSAVRIYLSATLQPELLVQRWKIKKEDALILNVASDWDAANSKIFLTNTGNMSYGSSDNSMRDIIRKINEILNKYKGQRGIIHTTTNKLTESIKNEVHPKLRKRIVSYSSTAEKMEILKDWDSYPDDSVLIGPSLTTGIDLKDDQGRFNIIVKLSYPPLGNALWNKRSKVLPHIYMGETASILEQACGRTTRSKGDWSDTYILDSRAKSFINRNKNYFSPSFLNRITNENS